MILSNSPGKKKLPSVSIFFSIYIYFTMAMLMEAEANGSFFVILSLKCWRMKEIHTPVAWGGRRRVWINSSRYLGSCSQLSLTAQPDQQDPLRRRGKRSKRGEQCLSNLRMPLANVQSQKIKWTKCDSGWPSSIKSDMLDNVLQACGDAAKLQQRVGIWEHDLFL